MFTDSENPGFLIKHRHGLLFKDANKVKSFRIRSEVDPSKQWLMSISNEHENTCWQSIIFKYLANNPFSHFLRIQRCRVSVNVRKTCTILTRDGLLCISESYRSCLVLRRTKVDYFVWADHIAFHPSFISMSAIFTNFVGLVHATRLNGLNGTERIKVIKYITVCLKHARTSYTQQFANFFSCVVLNSYW